MTCIVGIVDSGKVLIGGDSAGSDGWSMVQRADAKVFKNGDFLFGFTTSFRMGQVLRYSFTPPKRAIDKDVMAFMVTDFIDAIRTAFKAAGFAAKEKEAESGGTFLVGYQGRLFRIADDYQVGESADGYDACGCGEKYSLGSLFATKKLPSRVRVKTALEAAEKHSAMVRGPFHIESIEVKV
jgi:ATP-dependent protease HslVU (ClpYQ) peptidase subunit